MRSLASCLLAALTIAVLISGCGDGEDSQPPPSAQSPYHNVRPPEEYFRLLPFGFAELSDFNPDYEIPPVLEEKDYQAALATLMTNGLDALAEEERRLIVAVSWYGYVMQAETVRYRLVELKASSQKKSDTLIEERYRFEELDNLLVPVLVASRAVEQEGSGQPSGSYSGEPPADETIALYELTGTEGKDAISTRWERRGDQWTCQRGDPGRGYAWFFMFHFYPDVGFVNAEPAGIEMVEGRPAHKLRAVSYSGSGLGDPTFYWLDVETLLPRQYEYLQSGPEWAQDQGNTLRFTIVAVNGEVDIQPPDVDVTCVDEDFQP